MLVLFTLLALGYGAPGVVDRVVLVVDEELVLASEIDLERQLSAIDRPPVPFWSPEHATPAARLEKAAILRLLAAGVALYDPLPAEIDARITVLQEGAGGAEAWSSLQQRWGLDARATAALVKRRMVVERYLLRNLTEDPTRATEWVAAADALLSEVRPRFRIRQIAPRETASAP